MVKRHDDGKPYVGSVQKNGHYLVERTGNIIVHYPVKSEDDINEEN